MPNRNGKVSKKINAMTNRIVALTGPESTGKTTLARQLAKHFDAVWVPEFARDYLFRLGRPYRESDLLDIARGQWHRIQEAAQNHALVFADTSMLVMYVWSREKFGRVPPFITEKLQFRPHDLYLLCSPDLPWQFDPLRENPVDRDRLFQLYQQAIEQFDLPHVSITGDKQQRFANALQLIHTFLNQ